MSPYTCGRELKENPHQTSGFFTSYLFVRAYNLSAEGREGDGGELEVLLTEGNANDGDEEDGTDEDMLEGKPDATNENPEDVHTRGKAAGRLLLIAYFPAEGPQGETGNLEDLQTEGYANNGETEDNA